MPEIEQFELCQEILRNLPVAVYSVDAGSNRFILLGGATEQIGGYPGEAFRRDPELAQRIIHPDDRERLALEYAEGLKTGMSFEIEYRIRHASDGRAVWLRTCVLPVHDSKGDLTRHSGVTVEITDLRRMQERLQSEQTLLNKMIDLNPYGIMVADAEGRPVRWNQACQELFGVTAPPPPEYSVFSDPVVMRAGFGDAMQQLKQGKPIPPIELWFDPHEVDPRNPSKLLCLKTTIFPLTDDQGQVKNVVLMHEDITARKRAEELYRRRESILQAIAASAQWFLEAPDWRGCINRVLAEIGLAAATTRVYLFKQTDPNFVKLNCCWAADDAVAIVAEDYEEHPVDRGPFARWNELLLKGHIVQGCAEVFPQAERIALEARQIRSVLQIPVRVDGQWWGFLGFDDCTQRRDWSEGEIAALQALAGLLGSTIQRNRSERGLKQANEELEARVAERTAELTALNEKLVTLVDNLNAGVSRVLQLPKPRCVHANQACAQIFGYDSVEEFMALPPNRRYASVNGRKEFLALLAEKRSLRNYEVTIKRKDGSEAIVSSTATAHFDEQGRIDYVDAVIEDITERKRVERRLRLLSQAIEQSTEGIAVADTSRRVLFANQAFAAMHGMTPEEVMGRPVTIFHSPQQIRHAVHNVLRAVERTGQFRGRVWHQRKDGTKFPTLMSVSALRGDAQQLIGFTATALDVTDQLEMESQRQTLARAVENAGEGIGILDKSWRLTYANPSLAKTLGQHKPADILGQDWSCFLQAVDAERHAEMVKALQTQARWAGRLVGHLRAGGTIPLAVTLARIARSEGEGLIIATVRDQSGEEAYLAQIRKLTLDSARALEGERARLSRELHDELGQTLTAINLNLAWLTSRSNDWDSAAKERLAEVKQFVNQMLDSVRSLSTSLRPPILDNRGLVEAMRSYAADFSRRAGMACRVVAIPTDLEVHDPVATTLFRIFQEAMTNVARHSRARKCGIFLKIAGSSIELKIRDSGVGAVPKRLEGVQSLGIAGMRERAASVGGILTVENRPEGGVCVTARLPWQQVQKRDDL